MPRATASCPCRGPHKKKASPPEVIHTLTWRFFRVWCSDTCRPLVPGRIEHQEDKGNYGRWKEDASTLHFTLSHSDADKCGEMKTNRLWTRVSKSWNHLLSHSVFTPVGMWHQGAGGPNQIDPKCSMAAWLAHDDKWCQSKNYYVGQGTGDSKTNKATDGGLAWKIWKTRLHDAKLLSLSKSQIPTLYDSLIFAYIRFYYKICSGHKSPRSLVVCIGAIRAMLRLRKEEQNPVNAFLMRRGILFDSSGWVRNEIIQPKTRPMEFKWSQECWHVVSGFLYRSVDHPTL